MLTSLAELGKGICGLERRYGFHSPIFELLQIADCNQIDVAPDPLAVARITLRNMYSNQINLTVSLRNKIVVICVRNADG